MKYPPPQSGGNPPAKSTSNRAERFAVNPQPSLFEGRETPVPGSLNDASDVRAALVETIRNAGVGRQVIADQMSILTGTEVTVRRLNAFTAESREDHRFPAELIRAFCIATSDFTLLRRLAEMSGLRLINQTEADLIELGRQFLLQKRSEQAIAMLERKLGGVDL